MLNRYITSIHILIALITALILYISMKPLLAVTDTVLITDAAVSGFMLSFLFFYLKNILKYGHFSDFLLGQKLIIYSALGILFVVCWLGSEYLILYISFAAEAWNPLLPFLPVRIVMAILIFGFIAAFYANKSDENKSDTEEDNQEEIIEEKAENTDEPLPIEILERIAVKNGQKIEVIPVDEIIHLHAEGDYVMIHTAKGKFLKEQTMKSFESCLPPEKFVRVHRSSIINIDYIAQIELYDKQTQLMKLKNGAQVRISLTGYKALKKTLGL